MRSVIFPVYWKCLRYSYLFNKTWVEGQVPVTKAVNVKIIPESTTEVQTSPSSNKLYMHIILVAKEWIWIFFMSNYTLFRKSMWILRRSQNSDKVLHWLYVKRKFDLLQQFDGILLLFLFVRKSELHGDISVSVYILICRHLKNKKKL